MGWKVTLRMEKTDAESEEDPARRAPRLLEHTWVDRFPTAKELLWAYAQRVFIVARGNKSLAAKMIGIGHGTIRQWLKKGKASLPR